MTFCVGLVADYIYAFGVLKGLELVNLNIHRNINQNRAFTSGRCDVKRLFKYPRQILGLFNNVTVLYKRLARAGDVRLLKNVSAEQIAAHLSGNRDKRNRVGIRRGDTRNQVCSARARCRDAYAGLVAAPCVAARHMSRVLLLTNQNVLNLRIVNFIVKGANSSAGIAKDDLNALCFQTFYHYFGTANHAVCPSLCFFFVKRLLSHIHD